MMHAVRLRDANSPRSRQHSHDMPCDAGMRHDNHKHASLVAAQWRRCRSSEDDANAATNMNGMAQKTKQPRSALTLFIGFK